MSFTGKSESFLNTPVTNDGFFPDLVLGDFQKLYRVPAEYSQDMVVNHLRIAIDQCNEILDEKKTEWILAGATNLAEVSSQTVDGENALELRYQRAVFTRAMALLVRAFATMNRRTEAENLAKEGEQTVDDYFAQANRAIRAVLGIKTNITAELL